MREEDRTLLESLGLHFAEESEGAATLTIPGGKGIMSLPPKVSDEAFNEENTRTVAHTLMRFFQVDDVLVCISTRFALPVEGKAQPQWTSLSVMAKSLAE